ncbi:hypothetical protein U8607_21155 [Methylobacterium durans]|uniref:DUF6894 domain-containing protein n=1 Tax=Methylobacterium durans TaxID=2202825 RepID=A0A2U8WB58_9HYPH|nr:hypothetical protein [Methylobacterium durans]AWN43383.1 hypothetical protein DK389_26315 [Methylobacterium durans]MEA1834606.1 hypothetical protein [Methylobacterium durans]
MAKRFYFDLTDGHTTFLDTEGVLAADINEAVIEALEALREIRSGSELDDLEGSWKLVIRDEKGSARKTFSVW